MSAFILASLALAVAVGSAYWFPERSRWLLDNILLARRLIFGLFAVLTAFIFVGTGNGFLIAIGVAMFILMGWILYHQYQGEEEVF